MAQNDKERDSWIEAINKAKLAELFVFYHVLLDLYQWCSVFVGTC